ncbi:MAG: hypothetical protein PHV33_08570 [Elusimicrobiales bacterium]|nr:hypothetical protein [Elusimicrobiales bacterium]
MKKKFCAASVFPSLLIASSVIFASDGSVKQLTDVGESVNTIIQEQKDLQGKPLPNGGQIGHPVQPGQHPPKPDHPVQPGHPVQPPQPPQPGQPGHPPQPPQPPAPVDTTHAYNAGMRDGADKGAREGRREGYADGINAGEIEGRRNGTNEGDTAGRAAGYRDGYNVDQSAGTQQGNIDGQNAGINNGTQAGQRRCYDAGYTNGYNVAYAESKQLGQQDAASYSSGYAKGQADAAVMEAASGQKAGYQAGFSQRETELQSLSADTRAMRSLLAAGLRTPGAKLDLPIEMARNGYATPEERQAYERGYREGYQRSYRRAYDDAKRDGYNERYNLAYRRAYDNQYSISYRTGFADGKDKGYKAAYRTAYNSAYAYYYEEYSNREYADQRAQGLSNGRAVGQKEGFAAGCAEQTQRGYNEGYQKMAAQVYPGAFDAGKQAGIAAADKYYAENAVLKVFNISFYDENNNGKFEASENVMLRAEVRNFGFQKSDAVAITVRSERGEITIRPDLRAEGVGGRTTGAVNLQIGKLFDVVAPDSDALVVTFTEKGRQIGDARQMYARTNPNRVAIINKDGTSIKEKAGWLFVGTVTELNAGAKVLIIGEKDDWYKVRRSEVGSGTWTEGFVKKGKVSVQ